jgi:hypothetical protein
MDAEQIRDGVKYMQQGDKAYVLHNTKSLVMLFLLTNIQI